MSKIPCTLCPFCNLGCELGFEVKRGDVKRVEYIPNSRNEGRLCPKGNMSAALVNHRKRLYHALYNNQSASLVEGIQHLKNRLSDFKPDEVLVIYDSTLTTEELETLDGWSAAKEYTNLAYVAEGIAAAALYGRRKPLITEQITSGEYAFIVGDAFTQDSVISGYIGKAKADNRKFSYIVVDAFETNTSRFAHKFVKVRAGYESLLLYGLYKHIAAKKINLSELAEVIGIEESTFEQVASMIRNRSGILVYAPVSGRSFDPILGHSSALKLSELNEEMVYLPLGERGPDRVGKPFFSYLNLIKDKKIKAVVSFGASFPWFYPQLRSLLRKIDFVAAGSMFFPDDRFELELVLPLVSAVEKEGTISTLFGKEKLEASIPRISGTLTSGEYLSRLDAKAVSKGNLREVYDLQGEEALDERSQALMSLKLNRSKGESHLLVGSKPGIGFLSIFETEDWLVLNPQDAAELGVKANDDIGVETINADTVLKVKISPDIPSEVAVVSVNHIPSLALLELETDSMLGEGIIKPTWSKVWKK
ncbi:hypothetical protein JXM67_11490 [candidate division WOR-3 bacterium]|nr:hypothetical protein [candidate division WOR-3 bacterium]